MAILRRTEKAVIRTMCEGKLIEKRSSQELINSWGLEDTLDRLAMALKVR